MALSHTTIYDPITLCSGLEKANEPIPGKLTDRRKDARKEGQTDPILNDSSCQGRGSNNLSASNNGWEYAKSCFKEKAKIFSKNSTTQENITILRLKLDKKQNLYKRENFKPEMKPMI